MERMKIKSDTDDGFAELEERFAGRILLASKARRFICLNDLTDDEVADLGAKGFAVSPDQKYELESGI